MMIINDLKSILEGFLMRWLKSIQYEMKFKGLRFKANKGCFKYIVITRLESHFVIEFLGIQNVTVNTKFIIEDKPCKYDINYFINGGREIKNYGDFRSVWNFKGGKHWYLSNLVLSSISDVEEIKNIFDELIEVYPISSRDDGDLPFIINEMTTGILLHNIFLFSKLNNHFSFRKHALTLIINKGTSNDEFKKTLKNIFNIRNIRSGKSSYGFKRATDIISELKSLAYHKVHETTIDKFLQTNSILFAKSLGYKSAKSNINFQLQSHKNEFNKNFKLIPDFMLEREDGYYDILDLKTGLLSNDFALGDWSNAYFSRYGQKLLAQLKGYKRYFSIKENSEWIFNKYKIKIYNPKLIGIAGNHNNFNHNIVKLALEGHTDDFLLYSYNDLATMMKSKMV